MYVLRKSSAFQKADEYLGNYIRCEPFIRPHRNLSSPEHKESSISENFARGVMVRTKTLL